MSTAILTAGPTGQSAPHSRINKLVREAAQLLVNATVLAGSLPADHPLRRALAALLEVDKETARHANVIHWPPLFEPVGFDTPGTPTEPDKDYPYVKASADSGPAPFPRVRQ